MRDEPPDLRRDQVAAYLAGGWGLTATEVSYAPVGFGSYNWIAADPAGPRWFVTGDRLSPDGGWLGPTPELAYASLTAAATTTTELVAAGLEFVVAPLPDRGGTLVRRVRPDWTLQVFPYLSGWTTPDDAWTDPEEQRQVARMLGRLHAADPPLAVQRWDLRIPGRDVVPTALDDPDLSWDTGPYGEPTHRLLTATAGGLLAMFDRYDELVRIVEADPDPWVVTHGEPHSANVIRGDGGRMHLVDWDTVKLAPRERDLAEVLDGPGDVLPAYQETAGPHAPRLSALELCALWWALAEVCGYVQLFRRPHDESADTAESWRNLCHYAPGGEGASRWTGSGEYADGPADR